MARAAKLLGNEREFSWSGLCEMRSELMGKAGELRARQAEVASAINSIDQVLRSLAHTDSIGGMYRRLMPLIKEIEGALPLIATLSEDWQMDIALAISKFVIANDPSLTMTPEEQNADRDLEIASALDLAHRRLIGSDRANQ